MLFGKKSVTNLNSILKSKDITLSTKDCIVKAIVFPVVMYRCVLGHKENWKLKNWCFWIVMLEKTLENPLDYKMVKQNPKGNQPWVFIGRTDAEAPIIWPPKVKSRLIGKDCDAEKVQFSSVQSLSCVRLFETPWAAVRQASLALSPCVSSNSCPLSQWCHSTISLSVTTSPALNLSQHQSLF